MKQKLWRDSEGLLEVVRNKGDTTQVIRDLGGDPRAVDQLLEADEFEIEDEPAAPQAPREEPRDDAAEDAA